MRRVIRMACVVAVVAVAAGPGTAGEMADLVASLDHPRVGSQLVVAEPITLGHATLELSQAPLVRELLAGEERCGIIVYGPGTLSYVIDDAISIPVAQRNLKRASTIDPRIVKGELRFERAIDEAVIWSWQVGADLALKDDGEAPPSGLPEWAAEVLERPFFATPAHDLVMGRRFAEATVSYALIKGNGEILRLTVDPVALRTETLARVEQVKDALSLNKGRYWDEELAAQPIGRRWWERFPAPLVAVHESIAVNNDAPEHVVVTTESTLQATRDHVGLWRVGLIQQRLKHDKLLPNTVRSVTIGGEPADFVHGDSELLVNLDPPLAAGAGLAVRVVSEGAIALQPGGDQYWSLGTWPWYPQPDWNGEFATVELELKVPEGWTPFATGNRVSLETAAGVTTLRTALDRPVQFPVMAAGKYNVYTTEQDDVTCRVASYVFGKEKSADRLAANFFAAIDFYSRLFGVPYPFHDYDVIEVNDWGFGQAPAGIMFITQEAFSPIGDYLSELFSDGVNERYVHEVAHTWWGTIVKQDSPEEQWIAEGFAEYSAALCLEAMRGGGKKGAKEMQSLIKGWKAKVRRLSDGDSLYLANHLAGHDAKDAMDRWRLLYLKGPLVIHAIRQKLRQDAGSEKEGDRQFVVFLSAVVKNFTFKWATTRDLVGILSQMTHQDWQPFFDAYVFGTDMPDV